MLNKDQDYKTLLNTYFLQHRDVSFKYVSTFDRISRKYTVELVINKHKASVGKGDKIKDAENAAAKIIYLRFKKLNKL
jgi:dsRNA-specific ribonuclease